MSEKQVRLQADLDVLGRTVVFLVFAVILRRLERRLWNTYEDLLLSGRLLALVNGVHRAVERVFGLVLADTSRALAHNLGQVLSEAVLDVVADQHTSSVLVLRISHFRMVSHFYFSFKLNNYILSLA